MINSAGDVQEDTIVEVVLNTQPLGTGGWGGGLGRTLGGQGDVGYSFIFSNESHIYAILYKDSHSLKITHSLTQPENFVKYLLAFFCYFSHL